MAKKVRVGILFGGKSAEHEVALQSAKNIIEAIDRNKYEVVLIGIDKRGHWHLNESSHYLLNENNPKLIALNKANTDTVALVPTDNKTQLVVVREGRMTGTLDVVFPVLHGPFGEDGTIQGLLKLLGVPFVGADVLGSAVGMDKDVMKRLLRDAGLPIPKFLVFDLNTRSGIQFRNVVDQLGLPFFVKPANLGSSVGINKVSAEADFSFSIDDAFKYDNKILIEQFIKGREIECSVLGNYEPISSLPGEVIPKHDFYSYQAKYIDENGAMLEIPAKLPNHLVTQIQYLAIRAFKTLCCWGMARVDLFLTPDEQIFINEINTIPGFTRISMYPKLWEATGISNTELIDRLIQLALEKYKTEKKLKSSYDIK
ncbi:D-alanine--D-alanine ligase [candidate division KSB1 bacterium]|nr:D-alanine--D-alanine ligase [candidate division KSB1 bacterium]